MNYFLEGHKRKNTGTYKWDGQKNPNALPFWVADSDYETAPEIVKAFIQRSEQGHFGYQMLQDDYYQAIIGWHQKRYETKIAKEWIIPIPGVVASIKQALELWTNPGDKVLIQTPVYFQFQRVVTLSKRILVENKLRIENNRYEMDFEDLEEKFKNGVKMMVLCSPHNPVGRVWQKEELEQVLTLCQKYQVLLISDEIHGDIIMPKYRFVSMNSLTKEEHLVMVSTAPSKTFNLAGLKSAYVIIKNPQLRNKYQEHLTSAFLPGLNVYGILGTQTAYTKGEKWVIAQNKHLWTNYNYLRKKLSKDLPQAQVASLEGTYLAWIKLTYLNRTSQELVNCLSQEGITVNDGSTFGADYQGFIRFNLACSFRQLGQGIDILIKAIKKIEKAPNQ